MKQHMDFDLEQAKAGKPVEYYCAETRWIPVHFVGVSKEGTPIVQYERDIFEARSDRLSIVSTMVFCYARMFLKRTAGGKLRPTHVWSVHQYSSVFSEKRMWMGPVFSVKFAEDGVPVTE